MLKQPITFDSFIRGALIALLLFGVGFLMNRLSSVLLPFFIAWLLAYLINPLVHFLQNRCHLRYRTLSIFAALIIVLTVLTGVLLLIIPPVITEFSKANGLFAKYAGRFLGDTGLIPYIQNFLNEWGSKYQENILDLVKEKSFVEALQSVLGQLWGIIYQTFDFAIGIIGSLIVLLYMFFILQDYEKLSDGWIGLMPERTRPFAAQLVADVEHGMNSYFRGQGLVALCVGVLFSVGFLIVGFPMAVGLGMFMGFLNLVPYLQTLGFLPMVLLSLLKSADTGENFWAIFLPAVIVVAVVQVIQDMVLVPKIMGSAMGLKPAVILLSLSVWGSLLGFIGLIIALPLTTLLISYYRRFVLEEQSAPPLEAAPLPGEANAELVPGPETTAEEEE
ncbi:MAG: AI-2E family transporter [Bacteroidaceae bacterium]|nr:AI-2E family transporter [Bacteroidaceae bacterium]